MLSAVRRDQASHEPRLIHDYSDAGVPYLSSEKMVSTRKRSKEPPKKQRNLEPPKLRAIRRLLAGKGTETPAEEVLGKLFDRPVLLGMDSLRALRRLGIDGEVIHFIGRCPLASW